MELLSFLFFISLLILTGPLLGLYIAKIFSGKLLPGERFIYRLLRIDKDEEMDWKTYAFNLLVFNLIGLIVLFLILIFQNFLSLNPQGFKGFPWDLALNTAVSFVTNTNWQAYSGENSASYISQMLGFTVQNFLSAATGIVLAVVMARGIKRTETSYIGNFWVDITRATLYVLLPIAFVSAFFLVSQGVPQNLDPYLKVQLLDPAIKGKEQTLPMGPVASQEAIKLLGTNGGGYFGANSAHPFENPTPLSNLFESLLMLLIPSAMPIAFAKLTGRKKFGWVIFGVMLFLFFSALLLLYYFMSMPHPDFARMGVEGPYVEGQETRFGVSGSALFGAVTDSAETGAVNGMFDSYLPLAGMVLMLLMGVSSVFGGAGIGLVNMLAYAIIAAFIGGLMVGRVPEFLQKKLSPRDMWASVVIAFTSTVLALVFTSIALYTKVGTRSILNAGPHGISEVFYAYLSTANNNGSAFAGLDANTLFYNLTTAFVMFIARFIPVIMSVYLAGSFAEKKQVPTGQSLQQESFTFAVWFIFILLLLNVLGFFPVLSMGPILEHLLLYGG
ncbi:potassium-transporting ATPase subunit KdpA [Hydrogenobacter thermophilus]|uniref:potassium-transporting ATPase subunit KdpA n=1 Tax=Hydrogenobacter thermophilus TaxID=940 RepID=UPI0030F67D7C